MGFRIEERFTVRAPAAAVWAYLVDPRRVVTCLPGAELTEVVDPRTFHGAVKVKVGAMTVGYRGTVRLVELDEGARTVRMTGEGREAGGAGSARMSMTSVVAEGPGGETTVSVVSDLEVAGRLVQLGRGMFEQVGRQLFQQFAARVRATLEAEHAVAVAAAPAAGALRAAPGDSAPAPAPLAPARPVSALPLLLQALWALAVRLVRRLLGGRAWPSPPVHPESGAPPRAG